MDNIACYVHKFEESSVGFPEDELGQVYKKLDSLVKEQDYLLRSFTYVSRCSIDINGSLTAIWGIKTFSRVDRKVVPLSVEYDDLRSGEIKIFSSQLSLALIKKTLEFPEKI